MLSFLKKKLNFWEFFNKNFKMLGERIFVILHTEMQLVRKKTN